MDESFEALRRAWYHNPIIQFQLIENLKYRETVFLRKGCVHRCIKANAMRFLEMNFIRYHFLQEPFNLYGSLAHFPDMPVFSFNRQEKRGEQDQFNKDYIKYVTKYDFLMDIDAQDTKIGTALKSLRFILEFFQGIIYYVLFSGTKGFHIRVDYDDFPDEFKKMQFHELANMFKKFAENFAIINNCPDIDYSIYDLRRIAKTPYSVVYPYYLIALPMSDEMIANFDIREYSIKTQLGNINNLRNRGVLKREGSPEAFKELIQRYSKLE